MYKIFIEKLTFETIIGILPQERITPQEVWVDCEIGYNFKENLFINYADVCTLIEHTMQENKYQLIEEALKEISEFLCKKYPQINSIKLKISKPQIIENAIVAVEIYQNN